MTETASLIIKVDSSGADRATRNLGNLDKAAGNSERAANKLGKAWGIAIGAISSAAIIGVASNYVRISDAFANMSAKLQLVRGSAEDATKAQRDLFAMSQRNSSDLAATTDLYVKLGQASEELAANHGLLLSVTDKVSKALVISGADAASSAAVIRQFSQAMASGALRGDEFISVMEGAPRLAKAIADGMGVAVGSLRDLAGQGKLTRDVIIAALEDQGAAMDREFGQMPLTVSRATTKVQNAIGQLIGETDKGAKATAGLAEAIVGLADILQDPATQEAFNTTATWLVTLTKNAVAGSAAMVQLGKDIKATADGSAKGDLGQQVADKRMVIFNREQLTGAGSQTKLRAELADLRRQYAESGEPARDAIAANPLSRISAGLSDSAPAEWKAKLRPKATGSSPVEATTARTKATQELTAAQKAQIAEEENLAAIESVWMEAATGRVIREGELVKSAHDREEATRGLIDDMQFELSLVGMSNAEREKEIALRYAGVDATSAYGQQIAELTEKLGKAREAEGYVQDVKSGLGSLFSSIGEGSDAATASIDRMFDNLKRRAMDALADRAIEGLIQGFAGMAGGGGWAGFASGFGKGFSGGGGRATGGPVSRGGLYEVGEGGKSELLQSGGKTYLIPGTSGTVIPAKSGGAGGGSAAPQVNVSIHNAPAGAEVKERQNSSGGIDIEVIFKQIEKGIASNVSAGASPINSAMQGRYGLRPAV